MALVLKLNYVDNLKGKTPKVARASYRDFGVMSNVVRCQNGTAFFGETMSWPMGRAVEPNETVKIEIFNFNKYFSKKGANKKMLIGSFTMVLQSIVDEPVFKAAEPLLNAHSQALQSKVYFELNYISPDGYCGTWTPDDIMKEGGRGAYDAPDGGDEVDYDLDNVLDRESEAENEQRSVKFNPNIGIGSKMSSSDEESMLDGMGQLGGKKFPCKLEPTLDKIQDYQVQLHMICGRYLKGLNISPYIRVDVGSKTQYTRVIKSTDSPYFNEYFVFDFHTTKAELFDQVIQLTAVATSKSIPGLKRGQKIGIFKIDVGTVYAAPDHMFYHKWAVLVDPDDAGSGVKGYLKCDLSVTGKGEQVKIVPKNLKDDEDDEDIEANLLLPVGVSVDRQMAEIAIKIYRAEDLPQMYSDVMASVRKAIIGDNKALVDPYVAVSFAGQKGRTSACKNSYNPLFNEAIVFRDIFPPLCNRIKIQLLDEDAIKDELIATHYIDLHQIMYPGEGGFLPQLGPCWINFYGAPRGQTLKDKMDKHNEMNLGQGEGSAYRGRLLIAIKTELIEADENEAIQTGVEISQANPVSDNVCGLKEDFTLFCTVFDASMLCEEVTGNKEVSLELSIGVLGNELDGQGYGRDDGTDPPTEPPRVLPAISTLVPMKPVTGDKIHYRLPIEEEKPVLYQTIPWEDQRRRFYSTNMLEKIADKMAEGLVDAKDAIKRENPKSHKRLKRTLKILHEDIMTYLMYSRGSSGGAGAKTKLDKDRKKLCETQMERVSTKAERIRKEVCSENVKYKLRESRAVLNTIRHLSKEPQHSLPDVFIWMICNKKRIAYARIPARDIIYSTCEEEKGKDCGVVRTIFLRFPGKKGLGEAAWVIPAKLQVFLWLGIDRGRKEYLTTLPKGYDIPKPLKGQKKRPPPKIIYKEKFTFTLNAYMFLCRGLIGSDDSGLSDPFARVICFDRCVTTRICPETLSPCWDQLLTIDNIDIYFSADDIKVDPPMIIIEIFDHDDVGDPEFLGRAIAKPHIFMLWDEYEPPQLQWWEVYRAQFKGGELLACFELVQVGEDGQLPPFCPESPRDMYIKDQVAKGKKEKDITLIPIPRPIRPSVCKYRMEVLFWGVREMQKLFLMSVDRPKVDVECGGQIVSSTIISSAKVKPNFDDPVQYIDLELSENSMFWPPVMIRCVDNRQFGRTVIAGTHVINHIDKFVTGQGGEKEAIEYYDSTSMCTTTQMPDGSVVVSRISNGSVQMDSFNVPSGDQKSGSFPLLDQRSIHSLAIPSDNRSIHSGVEGSIHSGRQPSSLHRQALTNSLKQLPEYDTVDNRSIRSGQIDSHSIHSLPRDGDRLSLHSQRGVSPDRTSLQSQRALSSEHVSMRSGPDRMSMRSQSATSPERMSLQSGPQDRMSMHSQSGTSPERLSLQSGPQDRRSMRSQSGTSPERLSLQSGALDRRSMHSQSGTSPERMSLQGGAQDRMSVRSQNGLSPDRMSVRSGQDRMSMRSQNSLSPDRASLSGQDRMSVRSGQDRMSVQSQQITDQDRMSLRSGTPDRMSGHSTRGSVLDRMSLRSQKLDGDRVSLISENDKNIDNVSRKSGLSYKNKQLMTIEESRRLSAISESGKSRTGSLHLSLAGSQGRLDAAAGSQLGSKAGSRAGSRAPSLMGSQGDLAKGDAVVIDMNGKEGAPGQTMELGADGMPPPPVKEEIPTGDPNLLNKGGEKDAPKDAEELDWWSKYYVTLEDLVAETKEDAEKREEAQSESSDDDDDNDRNDMLDDEGNDKIKMNKGEGEMKAIRKKRKMERLKKMKEQLKKVKSKDKEGGENIKYEDDNVDDEKALIERIKFYRCELENVSGFNYFEEWLQKFPLLRGKKLDDEEEDDSRCSGFFKGTLNIYRIGAADEEIPQPTKNELKLMKNLPSNEPVEVKIRIYIIRANDLHPADTNGKADPYMCITLGKQVINDKKNYISKQLNPVFGKCYEMEAIFPMESMLTLSVIDWDMAGSDDLIGETKIDLENRFYSQHRATVGLANKFETHGYNKWRDPVKPVAILSAICKECGLPEPKYESNANRVKVGSKYFVGSNMVTDEHGEQKISNEPLALEALKHFQDVPVHGTKLVPEHIETRALFTPEKPGVEQGKLELWIDMFPKTNPPDSPPVDVSPRLPKSYELRVIIWNCDEVEPQETNMFSGEASSDIFVKAWLKGFGQDDQATDVHYNSMTGEGNFNWRFVFPFDYLKSEDKIVIRQKESIFSVDETEYKIQPRLYIQCWDADIVSSDDFIGSFMLHLSKFPRAAKSVKSCKKEMLNTDGSQPQISIFKNRRVKGWYPFVALDEASGEMELKGKVELEMHLVTSEEAETNPVGIARNEPEPLTAPKRPNYSFLNLLNPLRLAKVLLRRYRCCLIKLVLIIFAIFFLLIFFYSLPGYAVKKILGA